MVVYRFRSSTGEVGPLKTVTFPDGGPQRSVWNPGIRRVKALFDLTSALRANARRMKDDGAGEGFSDALQLTEPYLVLLDLVSAPPVPSDAALVQFGVVSRQWPDREEVVFLSRWHGVDATRF